MAKLYNLARMSTMTIGPGMMTLDAAVESFLTFDQAGVRNGDRITYAIEERPEREIGRGFYNSATRTLTRSVLRSTNNHLPINLKGRAQVLITAAAEDFNFDAPDDAIYGRLDDEWFPIIHYAAAPPNSPTIGRLWFDTTVDLLKMFNGMEWVAVGGGGGANVKISTTPPSPAKEGDLWWDPVICDLFIYYNDGNSSQWVVVTAHVDGVGGGGAQVTIAANPPANPKIGDLWWSTIDGELYIWYNDGTSSQWVATSSGGNRGVISTLLNAADDTAAAAAGVAIGQVYRNGTALMVRMS